MSVPRDTHTKRPCPNCPSLLEVIDSVLRQIQTETEAPMSIGDIESLDREFLRSLQSQLVRAREIAEQAA